jgi:hypothetical protein
MKKAALIITALSIAIASCKKEDSSNDTSPVQTQTVANKVRLTVNQSQGSTIATELLIRLEYLSNDTAGSDYEELTAVVCGVTMLNDTINDRSNGATLNTATKAFDITQKYEVTLARGTEKLITITSK